MGWTASDMPDLAGYRAVVTGANSGLGYEATRALLGAGARVNMVCRDRERAESAAQQLKELDPSAELTTLITDLSDLASIQDGAATLRESEQAIDILINNAGVMAIPYAEAMDGAEYQFAVNHLGHFALTGQLLSVIAPGARIVTVTSGMHRIGDTDWPLPGSPETYDRWRAYGRSKLANILFATELDRRFTENEIEAMSVAAHPGYADTALQAKSAAGSRIRRFLMDVLNTLFAQSAEAGVRPILYAATAPDCQRGGLYGPDGLLERRGFPEKQEPKTDACNPEKAQELWELSADWTGVAYTFVE